MYDAVVRNRLVLGEHKNLHRMIVNCRNPKPFVDTVQHWNRESMDNNREEYKPVDNRDHCCSQIVDFVIAFSRIWEKTAGVLDI
jgi:hypothetical protein